MVVVASSNAYLGDVKYGYVSGSSIKGTIARAQVVPQSWMISICHAWSPHTHVLLVVVEYYQELSWQTQTTDVQTPSHTHESCIRCLGM